MPALTKPLNTYTSTLAEGKDALLGILREELESHKQALTVAKYRANFDLPHIKAEVNRFESIITSLTSLDSASILCRHEGFLYSFPVPENLFKDRIFKYDALLDKCYRLQKQDMDLGNFCTIPVKSDLIGFLEDPAAPYQ